MKPKSKRLLSLYKALMMLTKLPIYELLCLVMLMVDCLGEVTISSESPLGLCSGSTVSTDTVL